MESMPFMGTDEIHMRAPTCKYADSKSGFNDMVGIEIRYRQGNLAVFFYWSDRRGGGCLPQRDGNECEIARSLVSSSRAEPSIFLVIVVYGIHASAQKIARILCFPVISHSSFSVVQARFLASLEMTIRGKRYSHFIDFPIGKKVALGRCTFTCQWSSPLKKGRA